MSRRGGRKDFSPQFERDYTFYLSNKGNFTFAGSNTKKDYGIQFPGEPEQPDNPFRILYSPNGKSAKECFHQLDSTGKCKSCAEPQLLAEILNCKAAINLQIKIWAQSRAEWTLSKIELQEYLEEYKAPEWVPKAIENQKLRILKEWASEKKYEQDLYKKTFELHLGELLEEQSSSGVILDHK
jgi:hypothetical protein